MRPDEEEYDCDNRQTSSNLEFLEQFHHLCLFVLFLVVESGQHTHVREGGGVSLFDLFVEIISGDIQTLEGAFLQNFEQLQ